MAVTTQESAEYALLNASPPTIQDKTILGGQVAAMYFSHTQSGVGDATSSVAIVKLPAGRVRLLARTSEIYVAWATASATLDFGWDAYEDLGGTTVAADPNGIDDGIDVETSTYRDLGAALSATGGTKVFESKNGVVLRITSQDVALADADAVQGVIFYVAD